MRASSCSTPAMPPIAAPTIRTRTRVVSARRDSDGLAIGRRGHAQRRARAGAARLLVNAAGPWVADVLSGAVVPERRRHVRLVQGSHIVVPRCSHDRAPNLPERRRPHRLRHPLRARLHADRHHRPRLYRRSRRGPATATRRSTISAPRPANISRSRSRREDVVWTYSGVRPLYDDGASKAQEATRDYVLSLDAREGAAPLLSIFGGKITTYRRLAEAALEKLADYLRGSAGEHLDRGGTRCRAATSRARATRRSSPRSCGAAMAGARARGAAGARLWHAGRALLGVRASMADLGRDFGADLTEREVSYLMREEWACTPTTCCGGAPSSAAPLGRRQARARRVHEREGRQGKGRTRANGAHRMSLVLDNISKQVGAETHISGVSLTLKKGSLNVLLGPTLACRSGPGTMACAAGRSPAPALGVAERAHLGHGGEQAGTVLSLVGDAAPDEIRPPTRPKESLLREGAALGRRHTRPARHSTDAALGTSANSTPRSQNDVRRLRM